LGQRVDGRADLSHVDRFREAGDGLGFSVPSVAYDGIDIHGILPRFHKYTTEMKIMQCRAVHVAPAGNSAAIHEGYPKKTMGALRRMSG
jgi:hypothetical protein